MGSFLLRTLTYDEWQLELEFRRNLKLPKISKFRGKGLRVNCSRSLPTPAWLSDLRPFLDCQSLFCGRVSQRVLGSNLA